MRKCYFVTVTMDASDSVVPLKTEKNMETVNSFLIRSYNPNTVAVSAKIKSYDKLGDEVTTYLGAGSDENTFKKSLQGPQEGQVFKMRPGKLIMYNTGTRSLESDLAVTDLEPRGRFYTTVLAKDETRPLSFDNAIDDFKRGVSLSKVKHDNVLPNETQGEKK